MVLITDRTTRYRVALLFST